MRSLIVLSLVVACMAAGTHSFQFERTHAGVARPLVGSAEAYDDYEPEDESVAMRQAPTPSTPPNSKLAGGLKTVKDALVTSANAVRKVKSEAATYARNAVANGIAAKRARIADVMKAIGANTSGFLGNLSPRGTQPSLLSGMVDALQNHVTQKAKYLTSFLPTSKPEGAARVTLVPVGRNLYQIETYESDEPTVIGKVIIRQQPFNVVLNEQATSYNQFRRPVDAYGAAATSHGRPADSYGPSVTA